MEVSAYDLYLLMSIVVPSIAWNALSLKVQIHKLKKLANWFMCFIIITDFFVIFVSLFHVAYSLTCRKTGSCLKIPKQATKNSNHTPWQEDTVNIDDFQACGMRVIIKFVYDFTSTIMPSIGASQLWTLIYLIAKPRTSSNSKCRFAGQKRSLFLVVPLLANTVEYVATIYLSRSNYITLDTMWLIQFSLRVSLGFMFSLLPAMFLIGIVCMRWIHSPVVPKTLTTTKNKRSVSMRQSSSPVPLSMKKRLRIKFYRKTSVIWSENTFSILYTIAALSIIFWVPVHIHSVIDMGVNIPFNVIVSINLCTLLRPMTIYCMSNKWRKDLKQAAMPVIKFRNIVHRRVSKETQEPSPYHVTPLPIIPIKLVPREPLVDQDCTVFERRRSCFGSIVSTEKSFLVRPNNKIAPCIEE
uniref:uncharacterized protein LOC120339749 n=1 Tax=Styela clava TaxID=7725 RepID=UPI0019399853|nr:uncharacterized protein LOC120339749 [Styela clava]